MNTDDIYVLKTFENGLTQILLPARTNYVLRGGKMNSGTRSFVVTVRDGDWVFDNASQHLEILGKKEPVFNYLEDWLNIQTTAVIISAEHTHFTEIENDHRTTGMRQLLDNLKLVSTSIKCGYLNQKGQQKTKKGFMVNIDKTLYGLREVIGLGCLFEQSVIIVETCQHGIFELWIDREGGLVYRGKGFKAQSGRKYRGHFFEVPSSNLFLTIE